MARAPAGLTSEAALLIAVGALLSIVFIASTTIRPGHITHDLSSLEFPDQLKLGDATYGSVVPYSFEISNRSGTKTVEILHMSSSCSCTSVVDTPLRIAPGGAALIEGTFSQPLLPSTSEGSAVLFIGRDAFDARKITLRTNLVRPLTRLDEGRVILDLNPAYSGRLVRLAFFLEGGTDKLDFTYSGDGRRIFVEAPVSATVDAVLELKDSHDDTVRIMQTLASTANAQDMARR